MNQTLKALKIGSATTRRQRMQERQLQNQIIHRERIDRGKQIMTLDGSDDDSDLEAVLNFDLDSSTETPSEFSLRTPEDLTASGDFTALSPVMHEAESDAMEASKDLSETNVTMSQVQSRPRMQATLTTMADWNYDRFSMFIDPFEIKEMLVQEVEGDPIASSDEEDKDEEDDDDGEDEEEDEDAGEEELDECSPIEIATPVLFTMPKTRPSVVSITHVQSQDVPIKIEIEVAKRPNPRRHVSEQLLMPLPLEVVKHEEPELFQNPNSSLDTFAATNNSSDTSRSVSQASHNASTISRSVSQTSQSDQSEKSPKRKSSMPLLFGGNKNGHSRMSSIKKFIRSSTFGAPSTSHSYGAMHRQPSGTPLETHFEGRNPSLDIPRSLVVEQPVRPKTARAPSPLISSSDEITALPAPYSGSIPREPEKSPLIRGNEEVQVKPLSKFRSRSGSFGHALKSSNAGPKKADISAPPVPTIFIPPPSQDLDLGGFPAPPPLTPRNPRRSMANYSPFPGGDKRTSSLNVGLGLRY